jgi:hypothetical protein
MVVAGRRFLIFFIVGVLFLSLGWKSGVCDNPLPRIDLDRTLAPGQHVYGEYRGEGGEPYQLDKDVKIYLWWNVTDPPSATVDFFICNLTAYDSWNESGFTASIEKHEAQTNNTDTVTFEVPYKDNWRFVWHNTGEDVLNLNITFDDDPHHGIPPEKEEGSKLWYYIVAAIIITGVFLAATWIILTEKMKQRRTLK